ncbi:receptor-like protein 2 [Prunus persica]|nr:receptor-like protein 2 [Prunus persica]
MPGYDDMVDFDGFQNLRYLSLANCQLTGQIPVWLSKLKNLEILHLENNQITGPIPSWLGTLPRLFSLNLAGNRISGEFPKELCGLPRLLYEPFEEDTYELELPPLGHKPANPTFLPRRLSFIPAMIDLSRNNIDGDIPNETSQLHLLCLLLLHSNSFSSVIPNQISNLKNLEELTLSMNHLSGKIPWSLTALNFLKKFDVSYNNLEGPMPTSTQIQSFDASAFEGNPKLCGAPSLNKCETNNTIDADGKNKHAGYGHPHQLPWFYISSVVLGFIVGFWGVCGSLIIKKRWRYAYFGFIDNVQDRLYVMMTVSMNRIKRRLRA